MELKSELEKLSGLKPISLTTHRDMNSQEFTNSPIADPKGYKMHTSVNNHNSKTIKKIVFNRIPCVRAWIVSFTLYRRGVLIVPISQM